MLCDPENTLSESLTAKLVTALTSLKQKTSSSSLFSFLRSPTSNTTNNNNSSLMSIIFVESRLSSHLHSLIEKISLKRGGVANDDGGHGLLSPQVHSAILDATVAPLARAIDLKLPKLEDYHPFRPTFATSRPELQLLTTTNTINNNKDILSEKLIRILVSWKERRIRAEIVRDGGAPEGFVDAVRKCLLRIRKDIKTHQQTLSSSSQSTLQTTTTVEQIHSLLSASSNHHDQEKEIVVEHLSSLVSSLEMSLRIRKYIIRFIVGFVTFVIGSYLVKCYFGWRKSYKLVKERISSSSTTTTDSAQEEEEEEEECSICLRVDSSSSSSSSDEDSHQSSSGKRNRAATIGSTWITLRCNHKFHLKCLFEWIDRGFNNNRQIILDNLQQQQLQQLQQQGGNQNNFTCACPLCRRRDDDIAVALETCGRQIYEEEKAARRFSRRTKQDHHQVNNQTVMIITNEIKSYFRYVWANFKSIFVFGSSTNNNNNNQQMLRPQGFFAALNNAEIRIYFFHIVYALVPILLRLGIELFEIERGLLANLFSFLVSSSRSSSGASVESMRAKEAAMMASVRVIEMGF